MSSYDNWKLDNAEDEYARKHPERRGVYTVTVTRVMEARVKVEVEASNLEDALFDAVIEARKIPFANWEVDQDDYDTDGFDCPPGGRDPDEARDD